MHRLQAGFSRSQRLTRNQGRLLCLRGNFVDSNGHIQYGLTGFPNLKQLLGGCSQQLGGRVFHLRRCLRHLGRRVLYVAHQLAQLFNRVIHRVGNSTRNVFCHSSFLRQIAFGNILQFIHQTQNRSLIGVVNAFGVLLLAFGILPLSLGHRLTLLAILNLQTGQSRSAQQCNQRSRCERCQCASAQTGLQRQLVLQLLKTLTQRLAVRND